MHMACVSPFSRCLCVAGLEQHTESPAALLEESPVSVFPCPAQMARESFLGRQFGKKPAAPKQRSKGSVVLNKPVTFHAKVKSSGYGSAKPQGPRLDLQGPFSKPKPARQKSAEPRVRIAKTYPVDCAPLSAHQPQHDLPEPVHLGAPINCLSFDSGGKLLCTGSNDCTARLLRLPCSRQPRQSTSGCAGTRGAG